MRDVMLKVALKSYPACCFTSSVFRWIKRTKRLEKSSIS